MICKVCGGEGRWIEAVAMYGHVTNPGPSHHYFRPAPEGSAGKPNRLSPRRRASGDKDPAAA